MKSALVCLVVIVLSALSAAADPTTLVVFHEIGCSHCDRTEAFLESIHPDYPDLEILRYEIHESESLDLLPKLLAAYGVDEGSVPILFVGDVSFVGGIFYGLEEEPFAPSGRSENLALERAISLAIETGARSPLSRIDESSGRSLAENLTIPAVILAAACSSSGRSWWRSARDARRWF